MSLLDLLKEKSEHILNESAEHVQQRRMRHYESRDSVWIRRQVKALYEVVLESLQTGRSLSVVRYATTIAAERFSSGFCLREVQIAFNALEECIWKHILQEMQPTEVPEAVSSLGGVLKKGEDAVSLTYFSLIAAPGKKRINPFT